MNLSWYPILYTLIIIFIVANCPYFRGTVKAVPLKNRRFLLLSFQQTLAIMTIYGNVMTLYGNVPTFDPQIHFFFTDMSLLLVLATMYNYLWVMFNVATLIKSKLDSKFTSKFHSRSESHSVLW